MNPYQILNVPPDASADDIKVAYHRLAKQWHPDRFSGNEKLEAEARFRELAEAFNLLKDPVRRAELDQRLAKAQPMAESKSVVPPPSARTPEDWFTEAQQVRAAGDLTRALGLVQYALRLDGSRVDFHRFHAQVLDELRGDPRQRIRAFEHVHRLLPKDPDVIVRLAELYGEVGLAARSQRMWELARSLAPQHRAVKAKYAPAGSASQSSKKGGQAPPPSLKEQFLDLLNRFTKRDR